MIIWVVVEEELQRPGVDVAERAADRVEGTVLLRADRRHHQQQAENATHRDEQDDQAGGVHRVETAAHQPVF